MSYIQDFFHFISAWKIWHMLFHGFIWLDWIMLTVCLIATILGVVKGFGFFFGKLLYILVLIFAVMLIYPAMSDWCAAHIPFGKEAFWRIFSFSIIAVVMILALKKLSTLQSKGLIQFHPFWDRVVGAASGFFTALLAISLISQFILLLPFEKIHTVYQENGARFGVVARDFVPQLVEGTLVPVRFLVNHPVSRA